MYRFTTVLLASWMLAAQTDVEWLNRGVQAFKSAKYREAVEAFQHAVDANPGNVTAHLYLGTAEMQQYTPGGESPENALHADRAASEFRRVLELDPANKTAMASIASLELNRKRFDEARAWYKRLATLDPSSPLSYYSIGFSIWAEWYPAYSHARQQAGLRMESPGPIPDPAVRDNLRALWWPALDEGIFNLKRALDLAPDYGDAMAYMNLFIRERADLFATKAEYDREVSEADRWVERALEAKGKQAVQPRGEFWAAPPPPPPPPPPPGAGGTPQEGSVSFDPRPTPQRIRVSGAVQEQNLVNRVNPVYPALARQAKIEGVVRFSVWIGRDGRIMHIEVNSGHPLLIPAALEAVKQWEYRPTLLNGEPVEVQTMVDVNFVLGN